MEVTADSTDRDGDGADENDMKVLVSRKMHQVSEESVFFVCLFVPSPTPSTSVSSPSPFVSMCRDRWRC